MKFGIISIILFLSTSIILSCSDSNNPVTTDLSEETQTPTIEYQVYEFDKNASTSSCNRNVFGLWNIQVDIKNLGSEITPSRNAYTTGDIFDADLYQFLTISPCSNCLNIANIRMDEYNNLQIEFRIKHPFDDIFSRPDLHGFDVRGIFVTDYVVSPLFTDIDVMLPDGRKEPALLPFGVMLNPDGFTSHYDSLVSDERYFIGGEDLEGNINPFLRFFENTVDIPFDPHDPYGHNVMRVGSEYDSRIAVFSIGSIATGTLEFYLIADVAYGQSAVLANRANPQYYLPAFNRTEPWRIEYWIENNNLDSSDPDSTADVVIQVFDWQHGAEVDPDYPDPENLSGIPESSEVAQLVLSITGLMTSPEIVSDPESGDGSPANPLQYRLTVKNEYLTSYNQMGLLAVRDELYGSGSPEGRIPIPESPSGFPYATEDILDYTLYHEIWVNYPSDEPDRYNNELTILSSTFTKNDTIRISPTFFMDTGHTKFRYYWDFSYNGSAFNVDGTGLPSPDIPVYPGENIIGLGILTNSVPPRQYIYSIPVVHEGEVFHKYLTTSTNTDEFTSNAQRHSVALTQDHQYVAFSSMYSENLDVWVVIGDKTGSFTYHNVTVGLDYPCINPSIAIVEDEPNPGIYVVFVAKENDEYHLKSSYADLDDSNFELANIRDVANHTGFNEYDPCMLYRDCQLFVYFTSDSSTDINVMVASSNDFAQSWIINGTLNTFTDDIQQSPSAAYCSETNQVFCVWEDYRDSGVRGSDVYIAISDDGVSFEAGQCLSSKTGVFEHKYPEISIFENQIGVVYTSFNPAISDYELYLKIFNPEMTALTTLKSGISESDMIISEPSITTCGSGKFHLAFGAYDDSAADLSINIIEIKTSGGTGGFEEESLHTATIGDQNLLSHINPCITSAQINPPPWGNASAIEVFTMWTTFEDGFTEIIDPEIIHLGHVDSMYLASQY